MFTKMIFPNIPVKDLEKTRHFFTQLGFTFNEKFSDENAVCLIINDTASVMMLKESFFLSFTDKSIADSSKSIEMMLAISLEDKDEVDTLFTKALSLGGARAREEDLGFMYSRAIYDLDGHIWEFFWMDENAALQQQ